MKLEQLINNCKEGFSPVDMDILSYILQNKNAIIKMSVRDLAKEAHTSNATIIRIMKKLGFSGYAEFKYYLKQQQEIKIPKTSKNNLSLLAKDIEETLSLIRQTDMKPLCQAIFLAKRIFIYGTDWGERKAVEDFVRNFMAYQVFATAIPSITELNWIIDTFTEEDLIIFISFSGENKELAPKITKLKLKNIPFCSITPLSKNYLASSATYNLYYQFTPLNIDRDPHNEYNFFSTLHIVIEALFRFYVDSYKNGVL
ncbi:MurR/RpiR family transcriptional regulator [Irregularibacter muris]|uniref:MurR/RpiR family transcriptional regulator n=1 Tax=Irregularibacter muris TaxID=1796619 RepID=A0AAE3HF61_9FIRM|nr:MurR/RpiR family transcriptional regulator [Irregularibacter muris]MCR1898385.1 MurR/RpiR family transcriptional regulator [Irregularibacter muris]